jgi:hypothetical protein
MIYDFRNPRPLPDDYPVFDLTDAQVAFSTFGGARYLNYYEGQCDLVPREWQKLASTMFFRGAQKADNGDWLIGETRLKVKDGIDPVKAGRCISALLRSFEPKHEEKEATVGFALSKWFDRVDG